MPEKITVNIIGSGIGGLFAGALLAKHGFQVNVFESRIEIGGYCSSWKRGEYTFESSLHEFNGFYPDDKRLRLFRFLKLFDKLTFLKIPSPYTSVFKDYEFVVPHGFENYKAQLCKEFPEETKGITYVLDTMKKVSEQSVGFLRESSFIKSALKTPFKYPLLAPAAFTTLYKFMWKKIKNPRLRTIISQLYLYYSDNINRLSLIYFLNPTYTYYNEAYWISGSSRKLVEALRDCIVESGGKVFTRKKVTKILFDNRKKACGVEVNGTEQYKGEITICNTPINDTFEKLIDKNDLKGKWRRWAEKIVPSNSIFTMYIGLKKNAKELGIEQYCYILNAHDDLKDVAWKGKNVPHEERPLVMASYILDESLVPKDKTVINVCIADEEAHWEKYESDKEAYKQEKKRIADLLLQRIENRFPGFTEHIEILEIGTPLTMKKFSNNNAGAVYGGAQEIFQTNLFRFPNEIKNKNLYFAGAWTVPGGGVSGAIISAVITSEKLMKRFHVENLLDMYADPPPKEEGNNIS